MKSNPRYVPKEQTTDWVIPPLKEGGGMPFPFKLKLAQDSMRFINKEILKVKETLYLSNSPEHIYYIKFLFQMHYSFNEGFKNDQELAISSLYRAYLANINELTNRGRELSLYSFYCMAKEKPSMLGPVMTQASLYTLATAFFIIYSSYVRFGNISTLQYPGNDGEMMTARDLARKFLLRTMADIEKADMIRIEIDDDADDNNL